MVILTTGGTTYLNDCILCDTEAHARAEGKTSWWVSTSGQPLCASHYRDYLDEIAD